MKNMIAFGLYIILNPNLIPLIFRRIYIPVFVQYEWLKNYRINTIIDVGAHEGKVMAALLHVFPSVKYYAFEPIKENITKIKSRIQNSNVVLENVALARKNGYSQFLIYPRTELSSLLPFLNSDTRFNKERPKKRKVKTINIDDYFASKTLVHPVFLKIDTQGTEGEILKYGKETLKKVDIIHIELAVKELYKGETLFKEMYSFLTTHGFEFMGITPEAFFYPIFKPDTRFNGIFAKRSFVKKFLSE